MPTAGLEPATPSLEGLYANHCATRADFAGFFLRHSTTELLCEIAKVRFELTTTCYIGMKVLLFETIRAAGGIEPPTTPTQREYHTPRPSGLIY